MNIPRVATRYELSDLLTGALFLSLVASAAAFELYSFDLWWHLATGRLIFSGAGIPTQDPFSFTASGAPWIDHEWLFQCLGFAIYSLGGTPLLVLTRVALVTTIAALVLRFVCRETGSSITVASFLLTPFVLAARGRFLLRPELFTILFSVLVVTALSRRRAEPPTFRQLAWIPLIFVPWANLHAGVIIGIIFLGLFVGGRILERVRPLGEDRGPTRDGRPDLAVATKLLAAAFACSLFNPFHHHVYVVPFELTSLIDSGLFANMEWYRPSLTGSWLYFVVLAATGLFLIVHRRRLAWTSLLPLLFLAAISLRYVRNTGLFSLVAPVFLASMLEPTNRSRLDLRRPLLVAPLFAAVAGSFLVSDAGLGIDRDFIPVDAVDFLEEMRPSGEILNDGVFGGYLAWRLWPDVKVFTDGRNEVFAELQKHYVEAARDLNLWNDMLASYGIGYAIVSYHNPPSELVLPSRTQTRNETRTVVLPFAAGHFPRPEWALVFWDDTAMVYVRRTVESSDLIERFEYRHIYPEFSAFQIQSIREGRASRAGSLEELERKRGQDPTSRRALELLRAIRDEIE